MTNIRLLPVVVLAIAALLVLKTVGLVTNGGYVLAGVTSAQAAGASAEGGATTEADATITLPSEPTLEDTAPTIGDTAPTLGEPAAEAGDHGAPAESGHDEVADAAPLPPSAAAPAPAPANAAMSETFCIESDATLTEAGVPAGEAGGAEAEHGEAAEPTDGEAPAEPAPDAFAQSMTVDCLPSGDAVPLQINSDGSVSPLVNADGTTATEQQILQRLAERRAELEQYEQDLAMRASLVDAAEKRIEERAATLATMEQQISDLVDQREQMESGQFAGIVAMYEAMKPRDAANIFNNLDMEVLLRVAKTMSPRKMAPIMAEMDPAKAQELTVKMASVADQPATEMTEDDLAALPQIVGQ